MMDPETKRCRGSCSWAKVNCGIVSCSVAVTLAWLVMSRLCAGGSDEIVIVIGDNNGDEGVGVDDVVGKAVAISVVLIILML